jgi:hypothetical protein
VMRQYNPDSHLSPVARSRAARSAQAFAVLENSTAILSPFRGFLRVI